MSEIKREIPKQILDDIYISLLEAYERIDIGNANIKKHLNYLEKEYGCKPPKGYDNSQVWLGRWKETDIFANADNSHNLAEFVEFLELKEKQVNQ